MTSREPELFTVLEVVGILWVWGDMSEALRVWTCGALAAWVVAWFVLRPIVVRRLRRMELRLDAHRSRLGDPEPWRPRVVPKQ